ncbi:monosaccharide ABC transporter membrane protein (CUT2 family) [Scopulibacillus darangshiensis]|uniref:Autoinducer 2 import system permease protein LsrC n=1 Tax=Scopulibacillus darangshiensis TaxID=442528 RepID=A0A4R2P4B1_9BACL|nr:monosaccharide ABC transporter membrane protein (CUT2 family) [Scopulibacillus darangshiensis]
MPFIIKLIKAREVSIMIFMAAFFIIAGAINPEFLTGSSLSLLLKSSMILLLLAIGQSFVLITGDIDVSVGSTMGLSAAVCGALLVNGIPFWGMCLAVLMVGLIIGFINGVGVAQFRVPAIIMTLGMLGIIRGAMLIFTGGKWIEDIPNYYKKLSSLDFLGLNLAVWIGLVIMVIIHLILTRTKFGRNFFAVGDNVEGARMVGLPVKRVKILAFMFSGISASFAALIFVMNIGFIPNETGSGIELQVIAAAVLGGVSLTGGVGSVIGAGLGAVFLTTISSSLVYMKVPAYWNNTISGFLLLIIVVGDAKLSQFVKNRTSRKSKFNKPVELDGKEGDSHAKSNKVLM